MRTAWLIDFAISLTALPTIQGLASEKIAEPATHSPPRARVFLWRRRYEIRRRTGVIEGVILSLCSLCLCGENRSPQRHREHREPSTAQRNSLDLLQCDPEHLLQRESLRKRVRNADTAAAELEKIERRLLP